jgi:hypothetical protein
MYRTDGQRHLDYRHRIQPGAAEMPQYYFDHDIDGATVRDDEGVTLDDLDEARLSALAMITALARGKNEDRRDSRVSIREGNGPVLMAVSLLLKVERMAAA